MQEIPTTVYTWHFEWIHFPAIDIIVPKVSAEYFITYFSFDYNLDCISTAQHCDQSLLSYWILKGTTEM